MTIFDNINFKGLGIILQELYEMHCNILIAGNTEPKQSEKYWIEAEKNYINLKKILEPQKTHKEI